MLPCRTLSRCGSTMYTTYRVTTTTTTTTATTTTTTGPRVEAPALLTILGCIVIITIIIIITGDV